MSRTRRAVVAASSVSALLGLGLAAAPAASATSWPMPAVPSGPYAPPTASQLAALRGCESGGNYAINTHNGFYGAYQFDWSTWHNLGLPGTANQAPPEVQDRAATVLVVERGFYPWPSCSRSLGLYARPADDRASRSASRPPLPRWVVGAHLSPTTVASQHETVLAGHVEGAPAGLAIAEQVYRHGWQTVAYTKTAGNTGFSFTLRPGPRGSLPVRVIVAPGSGHGTTATGTLVLHVR